MGNPYYIYKLSYHIFSGGTILLINHQKNIIQHEVGVKDVKVQHMYIIFFYLFLQGEFNIAQVMDNFVL